MMGDVRLSKKLSWVLRHGAVKVGLQVDQAGYVNVAELLSLEGFKPYSEDDIKCAAESSDKQRFSILQHPDGQLSIRANQGHSKQVASQIDAEILLQRLALCSVNSETICVHGTNIKAWRSIAKKGLSRMNRQMIHFARGLPGDESVISGMRASSTVFIYLDLSAALADGIAFYVSDNNVLLSPGVGDSGIIPLKYVKRVAHRNACAELHCNTTSV